MTEFIETVFWSTIIGIVIGLIGGISFYEFAIGKAFIVIGVISVLICLAILPTYIPYMEEKQADYRAVINERDNELKTMSCEELRLDIIDVMENDKEYYIEEKLEWEKVYYHHKCEIPLREEVMKLQ